jgi:hypothetical protein
MVAAGRAVYEETVASSLLADLINGIAASLGLDTPD